jgi:hypothetical protein
MDSAGALDGIKVLDLSRLAPRLGEHTREILKEFSFSDDEIDKLVAIGAARIGARNKDSGATSTGRAT